MHKKICENNNIYVKYAKIIIYKKTKVCYYQGIERRKRGKEMLQTIENVNAAVNNFVWGVPAMVCIIGVGLVLSARTGFIQFRKFGYAHVKTATMVKQKTNLCVIAINVNINF